MQNLVLSPIDPNVLIESISNQVVQLLKSELDLLKGKEENENALLNINQAAAFLHLSIPTIYSKHSKGEIPGVCKQGKRLYFSKQALIDWIKEGATKTKEQLETESEEYLTTIKKGSK